MKFLHEVWTEEKILSIVLEYENDRFEFKAGKIFNEPDLNHQLAKAIGALANSYGGYLIIGAKDRKNRKSKDDLFDGVEPKQLKGATTEHYLELKISQLLTPPLQKYRIREVVPDQNNSKIPFGKCVFVVEIDESINAPHQTNDEQKIYYYREGSNSKPAPHLYLEGLRTRNATSQKLVETWRDSFLWDLINVLEKLSNDFNNRLFFIEYDKVHYDYSISLPAQIGYFKDILKRLNVKQFFYFYPQIEKQTEEYLFFVKKLFSSIQQLEYEVGESRFLKDFIFNKFAFEELVGFLNSNNQTEDLQNKESGFSLLCKIFEVPDHKDTYLVKKISTFIVFKIFCQTLYNSERDEIPFDQNSPLKRFWNKYKNDIDNIKHEPEISKFIKECEELCSKTFWNGARLKSTLDTVLMDLTTRAGVPFEDNDKEY